MGADMESSDIVGSIGTNEVTNISIHIVMNRMVLGRMQFPVTFHVDGRPLRAPQPIIGRFHLLGALAPFLAQNAYLRSDGS